MRRTLAFLGMLLVASGALAQGREGAVPLLDLLEIELIDHHAVALYANGGQVSQRLHLKEQVLWSGSRGIVGVVITNERILAAGTRLASWQEFRYELAESPPGSALLGDRVALLITSKRALGFIANTGELAEYRLSPRERVQSVRVGENVGVVLTDRRVLGLSPLLGGFAAKDLQLREHVESVETKSALATVRTSRRLLVFRSPTGAWSERRRELNGG